MQEHRLSFTNRLGLSPFWFEPWFKGSIFGELPALTRIMGREGSTVFLAWVAEFLRTRFLRNAFLSEGNLFFVLLTFLLFPGLTSVGYIFLFVSIAVFDFFEDNQEASHVLRDDTLEQAKLVLPISSAHF